MSRIRVLLDDPWTLPRLIGGLTTVYSVAITAAPVLLAKPARLTGPDGSVPPATAALIRSIGSRDAAMAAALLVAPAGRSSTLLSVARAVSDAGDALWFGRLLDSRRDVLKVAGAALGWSVLELAAAARAERRAASGRPGWRVLLK